jgi:hypothetical protein
MHRMTSNLVRELRRFLYIVMGALGAELLREVCGLWARLTNSYVRKVREHGARAGSPVEPSRSPHAISALLPPPSPSAVPLNR